MRAGSDETCQDDPLERIPRASSPPEGKAEDRSTDVGEVVIVNSVRNSHKTDGYWRKSIFIGIIKTELL